MTTPEELERQADTLGASNSTSGIEIIGAIQGWAWTAATGYMELPPGAFEDPGGVDVWHHESSSWKKVSGDGLDPATLHESYRPQWKDHQRDKKERDGDIPEWDGKASHRTTYFRKIDLWVMTCLLYTSPSPRD